MRTSTLKSLSTLLLVLLSLLSSAQMPIYTPPVSNPIYTGLPWLRYTQDARAGGMAGLGIATSPDPASLFYNMGKAVMDSNYNGFGVNFTPKFDNLFVTTAHMFSISGFHHLDSNSAITGSLRYFSLGKEPFYGSTGNMFDANAGHDFAIDIGYSRKLSTKSGLGVALRYINSNLASGTTASAVEYGHASAISIDLGWYYDGKNAAGNGFAYGATLTNLGPKISYSDNKALKEFIPANLGLGANYSRKYNDANQISFGVEINKLLVPTPPDPATLQALEEYRNKGAIGSWFSSFGDAPDGFGEELREFQVSAGAEYTYNDQFAFRAGYFFEDKTKGNRKYFTLGAGVKYNMFGLNFSYLIPSGNGTSRNPLSNTMRFGLIFDLDKPSK